MQQWWKGFIGQELIVKSMKLKWWNMDLTKQNFIFIYDTNHCLEYLVQLQRITYYIIVHVYGAAA